MINEDINTINKKSNNFNTQFITSRLKILKTNIRSYISELDTNEELLVNVLDKFVDNYISTHFNYKNHDKSKIKLLIENNNKHHSKQYSIHYLPDKYKLQTLNK